MNQATRNRSEELHCCYSINLEDAARRALEEANQKQHLLESCSHSKSAQLTKESTTNCFAILFKHNSHHLPPKYPGLSRGNTIIRWKENEGSGSTRNRRATDCSTSNWLRTEPRASVVNEKIKKVQFKNPRWIPKPVLQTRAMPITTRHSPTVAF